MDGGPDWLSSELDVRWMLMMASSYIGLDVGVHRSSAASRLRAPWPAAGHFGLAGRLWRYGKSQLALDIAAFIALGGRWPAACLLSAAWQGCLSGRREVRPLFRRPRPGPEVDRARAAQLNVDDLAVGQTEMRPGGQHGVVASLTG